jgi:hypothetical protein
MCLFGSACSRSGDQEVCLCQKGFIHDFSMYHQPNCGLPEKALIIFVGIFAAPWCLVTAILLKQLWRTRTIRKATFEIVSYHFSLLIWAIGLGTQSGMYEVAIIGMSLSYIFLFRLMIRIMLQTFRFDNGMYIDRVSDLARILGRIKVFHAASTVTLAAVCIAFCRNESLVVFDTVLFVTLFMEDVSLFMVAILAIRFTTLFIRTLNNQLREPELASELATSFENVRIRSKSLRRRWGFLILLLSLLVAAVLSIRPILGSLPYTFVFAILLVLMLPAITLVVVAKLASNHGSREEQFNRAKTETYRGNRRRISRASSAVVEPDMTRHNSEHASVIMDPPEEFIDVETLNNTVGSMIPWEYVNQLRSHW